MQQVFGYIERITFQNEDNGYTVAHLKQKGRVETVCVVGSMPALHCGETVRCFGEWKRHLVHGLQFEVEKWQVEAPADALSIKKYLGSGLIKGIGPTYASRIVDKFGGDTLQIIDSEPHRLNEIGGLGKKRIEMILQCWSEQRSIREVMLFLQGHGISSTFAQKIFKAYGQQSIQVVNDNPYKLATDIHGIGFKSADQVAEKLNIEKNSPRRIDAAVQFFLNELTGDGHTCYPKDLLIEECGQLLQIDSAAIADRLEVLQQEGKIEIFHLPSEEGQSLYVWLKQLFMSEVGIARELKRLRDSSCALRSVDVTKAIGWVQGKIGITLADNQKEAVARALHDKVSIITGGPGTGKSTITNAILAITLALTPNVLLAAPTGRAAKRMTEITGQAASTIHSLLKWDFKQRGFKHSRKNPLECDLLICDEASMIDTLLMYNLLKAIPDHARVIFVGDINQLPSVGAGNVLKDMIASNAVSVTSLKEIFRQAQGSRIIVNAHKINRGTMPDIKNVGDSDFYFIAEEEPKKILATIVNLVKVRLPQKYGYNPFTNIQVLAPMKKGEIGIENLNMELQAALNPKDEHLMRYGRRLAVSDKVMQTRNDYKKEVFNGDVGIIKHIDASMQRVKIDYDGKIVEYDFDELDEVVLAYAVSIHKYQGSECPCIIIPVHTSHFKLLHRNLLYTAVTRGKKLVILVGSARAIAIAVHNDEVKKRYTGLMQALVGVCCGLPI